MADVSRCQLCKGAPVPSTDEVLALVLVIDEALPTQPFDRHIVLMARLEASLWQLLGLCRACATNTTIGTASERLARSPR